MRSFFIVLSLFSFLFCHSQDRKEPMELKEYKYKNDKRIVYGIDLTVPGPYELYINDIKVRADYSSSMHNTLENINQAVLKSGTYSFRLVVFPMPSELAKGGIQPETVQFLKVGLSKIIERTFFIIRVIIFFGTP